MAKRLEFDIVTDASKGIAGLKQFSSAAKKAMGDVSDSLDDTTTSAQKVAKALSGLADELETEMKGAAKAADALAQSLGPELSGRADLDQIVQDLRKMGLTFDEITADADDLAGSLRKLDTVQMSAPVRGMRELEDSTTKAKDAVKEIDRSAGSSSSALANMVGNSAQDIGELGGVAGSAGVAIGQMAEYMADAALEGEGLSKVLGNFAKVAGPIAVLSLGVKLVSDSFGEASKRQETSTGIQQDWTEAMLAGGDAAVNYAATLKAAFSDTGKIIADVGGKAVSDAERLRQQLEKKAGGIGGFQAFTDTTKENFQDISKLLDKSGADVDEYTKAVAGGEKGLQAWTSAVKQSNLSTSEQEQLIAAVVNGQKSYAKGQQFAAEFTKLFGDNVDDSADAVKALNSAYRDAVDPMKRYNEIQAEGAAQLERVNAIMAESAKSRRDAQKSLTDMADVFSLIGTKSDVLSSIFDIKNAPKKTAGQVRDVTQAIDDLSEKLKDVKVSDVLAGDVKADKFLDAIDALAPDIQARITETFATGGPEAATALANSYIDQVTKELGGKFTREQVATMLGLDDITATINVAIEQSELEKARKKLEVLVGLGGETPWTASIGMALDAGEITPEAAQLLIDDALKGKGVDIPSALETPPTQDAIDAANKYAREHPVKIPAQITINGVTDVGGGKFRLQNGQIVFDQGGTTGPAGGIVAERRPEIVDGKYLVTTPTIVPPGTRVTSGAKTARILRSRGSRGLKRYDAGGVVPANVTNNVTLHLPAGANGADVVRQVKRWQRRNGTPG